MSLFLQKLKKKSPRPVLDLQKNVGIDLGLTYFATLAIGEKNHRVTVENPKFLRNGLKKLRFFSRQLSFKQKRSKNRYKARKKLNFLHCKFKNQRLDFFYKLALTIVKSHDIISIETMNIKAMLQGLKNLARAITDAGWNIFLNCLKNKVLEYGKTLYEVSSLLGNTCVCSRCRKKNKIPLGQREYVCECGLRIDRDLNSGININANSLKAAGTSV